MDKYELFTEIIKTLKDGQKIIFTPDNVAEGDNFLIFGSWRKSIEVLFEDKGLWICSFNGADPILLEEVPESFLRSIYKNLRAN